MSSRRIRIQVAVLMFLLLPATVGILAVRASATCERFVRTYVTKPVRNVVSQETANAWAKWRAAHPNWKPNPNSRRPTYVMTREEAVQKVDFACSIPTTSSDSEILFTPAVFDAPPPIMGLHSMDTAQITLPPDVPPEVAELVPPVLPVVPVNYEPAIGPVPEPASLMLVGTGFGVICLLLAARARRAEGAIETSDLA